MLSYFNELNSCMHNPEEKEVLLVFTYETVNIWITYELQLPENGNKFQCQYTMQSVFFTLAQ